MLYVDGRKGGFLNTASINIVYPQSLGRTENITAESDSLESATVILHNVAEKTDTGVAQ